MLLNRLILRGKKPKNPLFSRLVSCLGVGFTMFQLPAMAAQVPSPSVGRISFEIEFPISIGHVSPNGEWDRHLVCGTNIINTTNDAQHIGWTISVDNAGPSSFVKDEIQNSHAQAIAKATLGNPGRITISDTGRCIGVNRDAPNNACRTQADCKKLQKKNPVLAKDGKPRKKQPPAKCVRGNKGIVEMKTATRGLPLNATTLAKARLGLHRDIGYLVQRCDAPAVKGIPRNSYFYDATVFDAPTNFPGKQSSDASAVYGTADGKRSTEGYWFAQPVSCANRRRFSEVQITVDVPLRAVANSCGSNAIQQWITTPISNFDIYFDTWMAAANGNGNPLATFYAKLDKSGQEDFQGFLRLIDFWIRQAGNEKNAINPQPKVNLEKLGLAFVEKHCRPKGISPGEIRAAGEHLKSLAREKQWKGYVKLTRDAEYGPTPLAMKLAMISTFLCDGPACQKFIGTDFEVLSSWWYGDYGIKIDRGPHLEIALEARHAEDQAYLAGLMVVYDGTYRNGEEIKRVGPRDNLDSLITKWTGPIDDLKKAWDPACGKSNAQVVAQPVQDQGEPSAQNPNEQPPLPAGWSEIINPANGKHEFLNIKTNVTQSERPLPAGWERYYDSASGRHYYSNGEDSRWAIGLDQVPLLPDGWVQKWDPKTSRTYYYNPKANPPSVWTRPLPEGWVQHAEAKNGWIFYHHAATNRSLWAN